MIIWGVYRRILSLKRGLYPSDPDFLWDPIPRGEDRKVSRQKLYTNFYRILILMFYRLGRSVSGFRIRFTELEEKFIERTLGVDCY